jgi:hypothetical protein
MDSITAATAAAATAIVVQPPSFDITFEMAHERIGTLPSLHLRPTHSNIQALE